MLSLLGSACSYWTHISIDSEQIWALTPHYEPRIGTASGLLASIGAVWIYSNHIVLLEDIAQTSALSI
jgi:hypothetical protein